jgi:CRP-like cAMP-binding protein/predicted MFS family arabinose efflux permease
VGEPGGTYRAALRHGDFRLMLGGFTISAIGSWAYNIALWVWVYDQTGSAAWVAAASMGRFIPALLLSTYGGVLAERFERTRVMRVCDAIAATTMTALAVTAAVGGPVWLGIVFAGLTSMSGTANDPAVQAMIPQVVGEDDLASANALYGTIENVAVIAGPAIGAGLLFVAPASVAFLVNASTFAISVLLVSRMRSRSTPTDVTAGGAGVLAQMAVGFRAIRASTTATILVAFSVLASFAYGVDTVLFVVLTEERFGVSSNGVGWFLTGLGVGGVLAAGLVNRLAALPRLGVVITVGLAVYCLPTAALVIVDDFRVAVALQVLRGAGTLVVDVLAITALQRSLAPDLLARVFGVFNTLVLGAIALGTFLTPIVLGLIGLDGALLVFGAGIPALALLSWPWLQRMDRAAIAQLAELTPRIKVLEVLGIFSAASRPVLERLAAAATEVAAEAGQAIVSEGETADAMYVLASGEVAVDACGTGTQERRLATLRGPGYFGEIGLIERIPRTATVRTLEPSRMWRIEGEEFLAALNEAPAAPAFLETARTRRVRTHAAVGGDRPTAGGGHPAPDDTTSPATTGHGDREPELPPDRVH